MDKKTKKVRKYIVVTVIVVENEVNSNSIIVSI